MKRFCSILLAMCLLAGLIGLVPTAALDPYDPSGLASLSQAELLDYFNLVVNRVRTEKPGFRQRELQKIDSVQISGLVSLLEPIINNVVSNLTPGDWEERTIDAGQANEGLFMSENANASDLRLQDITSISAQKVGDNWVIDVRVKEETNPAAGLNSANGRISPIATREQIVAEITGASSMITANAADATVRYGSGFARITVNDQGKVVSAANGFQVNAQVNSVKISIITADVAATMNSEWQCAYFDWAPEEGFPAANTFPSAGSVTFDPGPIVTLKWWQRLPGWLQWILRYVFFGWIWMR
ncbi:MAG: hypothetical protein FWC27_07830 [Firmicutes bacterium]|nr:hypothetical protein [Bacillota bacterium]